MNQIATTTATKVKAAPGTFATGKGTTAQIIDAFRHQNYGTVAEVAQRIGKPARQLNKRFAELVARKVLKKSDTKVNDRTDYERGEKFPTAA